MTTPKPKTKDFDCVEMMHEGAARVREELAGKTLEEQAAYWRAKTSALLKRQAKLRGEELQPRQ
jgi:hypothetical protein